MSKPFSGLTRKMSPQARAEVEVRKRQLLKRHPLAYIRSAIGLVQQQIAERLGVSQVAVSKLESRADFLLSTLKAFSDATGGNLTVKIGYADRSFSLKGDKDENGRTQFSVDEEPRVTRYDQQREDWISARVIPSPGGRATIVAAANHDNYLPSLYEIA